MKVWVKYLIGVALGIVAAIILPSDSANVSAAVSFLTQLFTRIGRYIVVPMIFSSGIVAVNKLRSSKLLVKANLWTFLIIILSTLILTFVGLASILIVKLPRIPITVESSVETPVIDVSKMILSLFPSSAFEALNEGSFLLVSFLFAWLIGWKTSSDELESKPVISFADSCSRLFYGIAEFFTEIVSIFLIAFMCSWTINFRSYFFTGIYTPMIIMFLVDFILVAGLIYPLILHFVCHDPHPYRILLASIPSLILGFVTGDSNLVLPSNIRHAKESLGIRRRSAGYSYPLFSIFARGGSALVSSVAFILIWRSYSSLGISLSDVLFVFGLSFGLSFCLGSIPSGGAFILLSIICTKYGRGFETSFLLLQPASMIICSFATAFDVLTAMFGSYIVSVKTKMIEHHSITHFI